MPAATVRREGLSHVHTVDNNIALTFRFVSVPFLWNDLTVLWSVFRAFYGNKQEQLSDVQVRRNGDSRD